MSKSLNSVNFTGYLGGDPRCHTFDDGARVANLSLAVSRQKKQDGEWVDDTVWVDVKVSAYADRTGAVDAIENFLFKGSFVAVTGELAQPREWESESGKRFQIVVDHARVTFGPRTNGAGESSQPRQAAQQQAAAPAAAPLNAGDFDDTDIPF